MSQSPERLLDMIPGGLAWIALLLVLLGAVVAPLWVIWAAVLLGLYSAVRFALAGIASLWGLRLVRRWEHLDWSAAYACRVSADSLPHHVVIIPNYNEPLAILRQTLDRLAQQSNAHSAICIVLAMEAGESDATAKGQQLCSEYAGQFAHLFVTIHPPEALPCKSANLAWAARWAKQTFVDDLGYDLDHLILTVMDSDTLWHPAYFASLSVLFATDPQRYCTFWQAPIRYHGNIWTINPLLRLLHAYSSAWELAYLAAPWWKALPMSSYSLSLRLADQIGYWDTNVIADEWHMYIKTFFGRGGAVRLQPIFLPFYAYATGGGWSLGLPPGTVFANPASCLGS